MEKVNKSRTIILRITPHLHDILLALAKARGGSISEVVRASLEWMFIGEDNEDDNVGN